MTFPHIITRDDFQEVAMPMNTSPQLFHQNPELGREVWHHWDPDLGHIFETKYMVDPIIDANKSEFNEHKNSRWNEGRRAASIPLNVFFDKLKEPIEQEDDKYVSRWLNDRDNRAWRTFPGKL